MSVSSVKVFRTFRDRKIGRQTKTATIPIVKYIQDGRLKLLNAKPCLMLEHKPQEAAIRDTTIAKGWAADCGIAIVSDGSSSLDWKANNQTAIPRSAPAK